MLNDKNYEKVEVSIKTKNYKNKIEQKSEKIKRKIEDWENKK